MATKSTAVALKKDTNIVSIMDQLRAESALMSSRTASAGGDSIRITQDKKFVLPDGVKTPGPLEVVVVEFISKNFYYENDFNAKAIVPPNCFAIGTDPKNMVPSDNSPEKQAPTCNECPMNQFGSKGAGKACNNTRALAVIQPDVKEGADPAPIWLVNVSKTAYKGFDGYVNNVARVFETPPVGVITTVGFNPNEDYPQLVFGDPHANPHIDVHYARKAEAMAMLKAEPDVSTFVKKAPAGGKGKAAARR